MSGSGLRHALFASLLAATALSGCGNSPAASASAGKSTTVRSGTLTCVQQNGNAFQAPVTIDTTGEWDAAHSRLIVSGAKPLGMNIGGNGVCTGKMTFDFWVTESDHGMSDSSAHQGVSDLLWDWQDANPTLPNQFDVNSKVVLYWPLTDNSGKVLPNGTYFASLALKSGGGLSMGWHETVVLSA